MSNINTEDYLMKLLPDISWLKYFEKEFWKNTNGYYRLVSRMSLLDVTNSDTFNGEIDTGFYRCLIMSHHNISITNNNTHSSKLWIKRNTDETIEYYPGTTDGKWDDKYIVYAFSSDDDFYRNTIKIHLDWDGTDATKEEFSEDDQLLIVMGF